MSEAISELVKHLITFLKSEDCDSMTSLIDSMPIITCAGKNKTGKVATEIATKGYCSTKNIYYFGLKIHALAFRREGTIPFPEMIILSSAEENDLTVLKREAADILIKRKIFADKIYSDFSYWGNNHVFDFHGEDINFKRIYEKMRRYSIPYLEMIVYIGNKERIMTLLCISLASEKAYNQRLNKLKKANQRRKDNISENSKLRFKLNLFITNVPSYILPAKGIQDLYHIKWQIELIFKQWKSTCGIHRTPTMRVYRFLCMFYAKLILILTCSALANLLNAYYYQRNKKLLSIHKCMKTLWNNFGILRIVIKKEEKRLVKK